ncbi:aminotransferase class I/II-fold pyridoxal phosphate-dependent enzyme [Peribacillus cavernae]|uniref:Aminotransferase class I/II-fold pyridoxal phosphate-dependent enzyme n=1 Tax=Peribacillus cavernae TaxID=1674310 RepID=A0A3S0VVX4_9BACI|nr:aminotransferase class I/II-fold pyridoxal phosphate-dependent enzyme [Peribacillus cavernae]MDQ0220923.1 arginine/lysine/ornithine decarboxylase [Peribacillus cavernae]RUQ27262.1 aminotransferase class I/II-fold pyridoxal phosphate-dependent enzyme [Peribacillus cavernae]
MNQSVTPIFDVLLKHKSNKPVSYHVPGHKGGLVFTERGRQDYQSLLSLDVTELNGLDDLHAPEGPILEAQRLLADLYKVRESYFLINGSTVGNLAMILAVCKAGDTVLVQRNCHKSILHGLMLANVKPVFISPAFYREWEVAGGIDSLVVDEALTKYPDTKAVILAFPTYYGIGNDEISAITELAHKRKIPVLVDEAHGAHFILGSPFLQSSLTAGADIVVHSAHKTLPAMTMGSYLHINSDLIDADRVRFYLQMLQSSSPSYPIMASLDLARSYLASFSEEDKMVLGEKITDFRQQLDRLPGIMLLQSAELDRLKVTIRAKKGITGFQLQKTLETKGLFTELADTQNVLFVLPLLKAEMEYPFSETVQRIGEAAAGMDTPLSVPVGVTAVYGQEKSISELKLSYSDMKEKRKMLVPLEESSGSVAAEMIIPYPPGVPLVMEGELIEDVKVKQLEDVITKGARFHGGSHLEKGLVWVFE